MGAGFSPGARVAIYTTSNSLWHLPWRMSSDDLVHHAMVLFLNMGGGVSPATCGVGTLYGLTFGPPPRALRDMTEKVSSWYDSHMMTF
jgi:hypothetical protein